MKHLLQASRRGIKTRTLHLLKLSVSCLVIQKVIVKDFASVDFCIYKQIHTNFTTYLGGFFVISVFVNFNF